MAIGWTVIILIGCLTPHSELPDELLTWNDKGQHMSIFALFAILWRMTGLPFITVMTVGLLFGGLIEVLQYLLPINRSGDWLDLAADFVGVLIGLLIAPAIQKMVNLQS